MAGYNLKDEEEVKEYLKNLYIEYQFGCLKEKKPEVCHLLGDYLDTIKQDYNEASKVYKSNCDERKFNRSCTKFGEYLFAGRGCEKNMRDAFKYMKQGCELNDPKGCLDAGAFAVSDEKLEESRDTQVAVGIKMLKQSCEANELRACFYLSGIFLNGIEGYVEKNMKEAYVYSLKCCEAGNPYACANVSIMHKKGEGVQKNDDMADVFKRRADLLLKEMREVKRQLKFQQGINP